MIRLGEQKPKEESYKKQIGIQKPILRTLKNKVLKQSTQTKEQSFKKQIGEQKSKEQSYKKQIGERIPKEQTFKKQTEQKSKEQSFKKQISEHKPKEQSYKKQIGERIPKEQTFKKQIEQKSKEQSFKKQIGEHKPKEKSNKKQIGERIPKEQTFKKQIGEQKPKEQSFKKQIAEHKPKEQTFKKQIGEQKPKEQSSKKQIGEHKSKEQSSKKLIVGEHKAKEQSSKKQIGEQKSIEKSSKKQIGERIPKEQRFKTEIEQKPKEQSYKKQIGERITKEQTFKKQIGEQKPKQQYFREDIAGDHKPKEQSTIKQIGIQKPKLFTLKNKVLKPSTLTKEESLKKQIGEQKSKEQSYKKQIGVRIPKEQRFKKQIGEQKPKQQYFKKQIEGNRKRKDQNFNKQTEVKLNTPREINNNVTTIDPRETLSKNLRISRESVDSSFNQLSLKERQMFWKTMLDIGKLLSIGNDFKINKENKRILLDNIGGNEPIKLSSKTNEYFIEGNDLNQITWLTLTDIAGDRCCNINENDNINYNYNNYINIDDIIPGTSRPVPGVLVAEVDLQACNIALEELSDSKRSFDIKEYLEFVQAKCPDSKWKTLLKIKELEDGMLDIKKNMSRNDWESIKDLYIELKSNGKIEFHKISDKILSIASKYYPRVLAHDWMVKNCITKKLIALKLGAFFLNIFHICYIFSAQEELVNNIRVLQSNKENQQSDKKKNNVVNKTLTMNPAKMKSSTIQVKHKLNNVKTRNVKKKVLPKKLTTDKK